MGLFDGVPGAPGRTGASADVAAALGLPVLLVLDVSGQAQSAAAIVKGCMVYDPRLAFAGVVLNQIASPRHELLVRGAVEALGVPVLGCLPRNAAVALPERHLGLVQAGETAGLEARLEAMADFVAAHADLEAVLAGARTSGPPVPTSAAMERAARADRRSALPGRLPPPGQRIAIARDAAFTFIYPHLTAGWRAAGAQIAWFSPLADEAPPRDCDVCWLPGGYPELHAGALAAAGRFRAGLRAFAQDKPVHGECGGYMALGATLTDAAGAVHEMAGLLGVCTSFAKRRMNLGYRRIALAADGCLGAAGTVLAGHEFHYASIADPGGDAPLGQASDAYGSPPAPAGSRRGRVTGSFFHAIARA